MKLPVLGAIVLIALAAAVPAQAHGYVSVGIGCCGGGYYPYYPHAYYPAPYYYGYPSYYYAPPPTVLYAAPPSTTYIEQAPAPYPSQGTYAPQQPSQPASAEAAPAPAPAAPSSSPGKPGQTYTDDQGRTCRNFRTLVEGDPVSGTACLQPDGTWRTVGQ